MDTSSTHKAAVFSRVPLLLLVACIVLVPPITSPTSADEPQRPNVLFIAVDDLNDWVSALNGHPQSHTPNIDRLADRGVMFTSAHTAVPLCNASRAALMTGLRPSDTGVYNNHQPFRKVAPDVTTLPMHFQDNGYTTRRAGKIYHGRFPDPASWDMAFPSLHQNRPTDPKPNDRPINGIEGAGHFDWGPVRVPDEKMGDYQVTSWIIEQMETNSEKPFFLACGIYRPHLPWYVPPKFFDDIDPLELQLPPYKPNDLADVPKPGVQFAQTGLNGSDHKTVLGHDEWHAAVRGYLASIRFADRQVGRLLDALEETGHRDDTIVVLWSDHGWHLGEKDAWRKFTLWERSTRVPMIVVAPEGTPGLPEGTPVGAVSNRPVSLMDLYPTITKLAGLPVPDHVQAKSLLPLLKDPDADLDRKVLTTHGFRNYAVRSQHFRYIRYQNGGEELYDHRRDPNEWTNLADHPAYQDVKKRLKKRLPDEHAPPGPEMQHKWWPGKPE